MTSSPGRDDGRPVRDRLEVSQLDIDVPMVA